MATSKEELQALNEEQIKALLVQSSQVVKRYVDERDEATKSELQEAIVNELSEVEGLGENLEKLQELSKAFVSVFDENSDGKITPEEIIAKVSLVNVNIEKVAGDLTSLGDIVEALESNVAVNTQNIKTTQTDVAGLQATVNNDLFTKEDVRQILTVAGDAVVKAVEDVFFPASDSSNGGNAL